MRSGIVGFILLLVFPTIALTQETSRDQKIQQIQTLVAQIQSLENELLLPSPEDVRQARADGLEAVRLMPREKYDHKLAIQGGGAFYSFTNKSHDYQQIAQIMLEQGYLGVGFAGANYGFIGDLGNIPISTVTLETEEISFLVNYKPPTVLSEIRKEQARDYETEKGTFRRRVLSSVSHSYALRAISFDQADVLVAFKIIRKDTDGSLVIFWKMLENFEIPTMVRDNSDK